MENGKRGTDMHYILHHCIHYIVLFNIFSTLKHFLCSDFPLRHPRQKWVLGHCSVWLEFSIRQPVCSLLSSRANGNQTPSVGMHTLLIWNHCVLKCPLRPLSCPDFCHVLCHFLCHSLFCCLYHVHHVTDFDGSYVCWSAQSAPKVLCGNPLSCTFSR